MRPPALPLAGGSRPKGKMEFTIFKGAQGVTSPTLRQRRQRRFLRWVSPPGAPEILRLVWAPGRWRRIEKNLAAELYREAPQRAGPSAGPRTGNGGVPRSGRRGRSRLGVLAAASARTRRRVLAPAGAAAPCRRSPHSCCSGSASSRPCAAGTITAGRHPGRRHGPRAPMPGARAGLVRSRDHGDSGPYPGYSGLSGQIPAADRPAHRGRGRPGRHLGSARRRNGP
jgi:hypothetical protein